MAALESFLQGGKAPMTLPSSFHGSFPSGLITVTVAAPSRTELKTRTLGSTAPRAELSNDEGFGNRAPLTGMQKPWESMPVSQSLPKPSGDAQSVRARATRGRTRNGAATLSGVREEDSPKAKQDKLREALAFINKKHGDGTCSFAGEGNFANIATVSTGILPLDIVLGGGWPIGKVVEIFGAESSGKTTIGLYAIAEAQSRGECAAFIDAEHALNKEYAEKLGVRWDNSLLIAQPKCGEHAIDLAEHLMRTGEVRVIVIDSVSALVPQAELETDVGEGSLGQLARLMSASMRKLQPTANQNNTTLIFLNQQRSTIGTYGNPETTSGGRALKYSSYLRCEVRKSDIKKGPIHDISYTCRVRLAKSKMGNVGAISNFEVLIGEGIHREATLLDVAEKMDLIERKGSWYYISGGTYHGSDKAVAYLQANPDFTKELEIQVKKKLAEGKAPPPEIVEGTDEDDDSDDENDDGTLGEENLVE